MTSIRIYANYTSTKRAFLALERWKAIPIIFLRQITKRFERFKPFTSYDNSRLQNLPWPMWPIHFKVLVTLSRQFLLSLTRSLVTISVTKKSRDMQVSRTWRKSSPNFTPRWLFPWLNFKHIFLFAYDYVVAWNPFCNLVTRQIQKLFWFGDSWEVQMDKFPAAVDQLFTIKFLS